MTAARDMRDERGQAAVEFAMVMPLLVVLLLGVIQVGVAFHDYVTLTDAARAGTRKAVVSRFAGGSVTDAKQAVRDSASDLNQAKLFVDVTNPTWNVAGSIVTVTAKYPYSIKIPLLGVNLMSGNLTATSKGKLE